MTTRTLSSLIVQHVDAHQRDLSTSTEAAARALTEELEAWELSDSFESRANVRCGTAPTRPTRPTSPFRSVSTTTSATLESTLLQCLDCILQQQSTTDTDRAMELLCLVAVQRGVQEPLLQRAIDATLASSDKVRLQACRGLSFWGSQGDSRVTQALLPRLLDKSQAVRLAAIQACAGLSASKTSASKTSASKTSHLSIDLQQALLWSCAHDPGVSNRAAALETCAQVLPASLYLPRLLQRLKDAKAKVRVTAVHLLHNVALYDLTASQCATIVQAGLTPRCHETCDATKTLLCTKWIKQAKYDPLQLLQHLEPRLYPDECQAVLKVLLDAVHAYTTNNHTDANAANILASLSQPEIGALCQGMNLKQFSNNPTQWLQSSETLLLARMQESCLQHLDITKICDLLVEYLEKLITSTTQDNEELLSCCHQLLHLAKHWLHEEGSRRYFVQQFKTLIPTLPEPILEDAMETLHMALDDQDYVTCTMDMLHRIQTDNDTNQETLQLRQLSLLALALERTRTLPPNRVQSVQSLIMEAIDSQHNMLRQAAVGCLGRLALLVANHDKDKMETLLQTILENEDVMDIRAQALLALSDCTLLKANTTTTLETTLSLFLQHENPSVVAMAAEVTTKLLFHDKIQQPNNLLATLLVISFDKQYAQQEQDTLDVTQVGSVYRMQQLLTVFFPAYAMKHGNFLEALSPMLSKVTSSKQRWPIGKMIDFCYSTAQDEKSALIICLEIASFLTHHHDTVTVTQLRTLCKLLGGADVDVETTDHKLLRELQERVNALSMLVTDQTSLESLETMMELLEDVPNESEEEIVADMQAVKLA